MYRSVPERFGRKVVVGEGEELLGECVQAFGEQVLRAQTAEHGRLCFVSNSALAAAVYRSVPERWGESCW